MYSINTCKVFSQIYEDTDWKITLYKSEKEGTEKLNVSLSTYKNCVIFAL